MLNTGLIGLGNMGMLHMMNCLHIDEVKVVAVADKSKRALKRAETIGVKNLYRDYRDLLNNSSNLDAVIISLPNFLHLESIECALEDGLNVFVEKPMARTLEECRKIVKVVDNSGRKFMVGHSMRFIEAIEKMKESLEKGHIGNLELVTLEEIINGPFSHGAVPSPIPEWWFDPEKTGGGALLDLGYHLIDLFRFFAGDAEVLFSCLDYKFNLRIEDGATIVLQSDSSSRGVINVGWYQRTIFPRFNLRMILHGNAGYLSSDELIPRNLYFHALKEGMKNFSRKLAGRKIRPLSYTYYYESYFKELKHFFDCLKNDCEPSITAIDGLKTLELIEEVYKFSNRNFTHTGER